jgi:hypothetical protein
MSFTFFTEELMVSLKERSTLGSGVSLPDWMLRSALVKFDSALL